MKEQWHLKMLERENNHKEATVNKKLRLIFSKINVKWLITFDLTLSNLFTLKFFY